MQMPIFIFEMGSHCGRCLLSKQHCIATGFSSGPVSQIALKLATSSSSTPPAAWSRGIQRSSLPFITRGALLVSAV